MPGAPLYTTKSHWRVLRRGKAGDHWTDWLPGPAQDFTSSSERLYVACGRPGDGYKSYGADGPGVIFAYDYRSGATKPLLELSTLFEGVFDDPWVHSGHLLSVMTWPPEPKKFTKHWYPFQTDLYRMTDVCSRLERVPSGWEIHGFDPIRRKFLGLHVNRSNMGFDFREVAVEGMTESELDEDVDAVDLSTEAGHSPVVDDRKGSRAFVR